jgi:hypothetical protein
MTIVLNWHRVCDKFRAKIRMFENKFDVTVKALMEEIDKELAKDNDDLLTKSNDGKLWFLDLDDETFLKLHHANIDHWFTPINKYLETHTHGTLQIQEIEEDCVTIAYRTG